MSGHSTGDQSNNQQINQLSTKFISLEAPKSTECPATALGVQFAFLAVMIKRSVKHVTIELSVQDLKYIHASHELCVNTFV